MFRGFRDFLMRGNVIELAVAVVIGAAFTNVVSQFNKSFLDPVLRFVTGGKKVSGIAHIGKDIPLDWGSFINVVIAFVLTAAVVYFLFIAPMNKLNERRARGRAPEPKAPSDEIRLLTEIRDALVSGGNAPGGNPPARSDRNS